MKKEKSVKKNYQFKAILKKGKNTANEVVRISYKENGLNLQRIGIAIRKTVKSSILRNRLKRLVREVYRVNKLKLKKGIDIIVVVNQEDVTYEKVKIAMENCFKRLNIYEENNN